MRLPPVYAITDPSAGDPVEVARRLIAVGVRAVQLRDQALDDRERLAAAEAIARLCRPAGALAFVNDRVDIAALAGTGVHLGEDDLAAGDARAILPPGSLIGVSTHDVAAAQRAFGDPAADYVAFGPVFESGTKPERPPRGLEELARAAAGRRSPSSRSAASPPRGSTRSGTPGPMRRR